MTRQGSGQSSQTDTDTSRLLSPRISRSLGEKTPRRSLSSPSLRLPLRDQNIPCRSRSAQRHQSPQRGQPRSSSHDRNVRRQSCSSQRHRWPRQSQSWLSYLSSPSWSSCIMIIFLFALFTIPFTTIWCDRIGIDGEGVDRNTTYTSDSFDSFDVPLEQISLGNDFLDCLSDLHVTRQHLHAASYLTSLTPRVTQYQHVLQNPRGLSNNLITLTRTHQEIFMNANFACDTGSRAISTIIQQARFQDTMSPAHEFLHTTSDYVLGAFSAVQTTKEVTSKVAVQIHQEIARLRRIKRESEMGVRYIAWGWLEDVWRMLQPRRNDMRRDREKATEFLKWALVGMDRGTAVLQSSNMLLQQCATNTRSLQNQVEIASTLDHAQLQYLSSSIESFKTRLYELQQTDPLSLIAQIGTAGKR
ncbi:hypothetical protein FRB95_014016 [Tulasnella sp. JGI-2019a]|nr:hypothetical protein FRB95_014016 [Tulasnella sp. JGI-2019a]